MAKKNIMYKINETTIIKVRKRKIKNKTQHGKIKKRSFIKYTIINCSDIHKIKNSTHL